MFFSSFLFIFQTNNHYAELYSRVPCIKKYLYFYKYNIYAFIRYWKIFYSVNLCLFKENFYYTLSSIINSFFQTLFIAEIHIGSCVLMYNPFVSVVVYNPTCGHIVMHVIFLSSHLSHFCNIVLATHRGNEYSPHASYAYGQRLS